MCSGAMKDVDGAIASYEESVELLTKLPDRDIEVLILITTLYCQLCPSLGRVNARQSSIGIPDPPMLRIIDMKRCLYL